MKKRTNNLRLRPAGQQDSSRLLRWRNDRRIYAHYLDPKPVARADHEAWLERKLRSDDTGLFIIEDGSRPVGQLRLDRVAPDRHEVSFCVDPKEQGRGLGTGALRAIPARLHGRTVKRVEARVVAENTGSLIAFLRAGFTVSGTKAADGKLVVVLTRRMSGVRQKA